MRRSRVWILVVMMAVLLVSEAAQARGHRRGRARGAGPAAAVEDSGDYGARLCKVSGYHCMVAEAQTVERTVQTRRGPVTRTVRVGPSWESFWPDPRERDIVRRINRMNTGMRGGMTLAVPDDMEGKTVLDFSPFPQKIQGQGERLLIFDPGLLAWAAFDADGRQLRWGPAAGGKDYCPDIHRSCHTAVGKFRVNFKGGRGYHSHSYPVGCRGPGCAPMPWFVHFGEGCGFHHSTSVPGMNASHGCVRLFYEDAQWIHQEFAEIGTKVRVRPYPNNRD
jgi:L,D-transpeptidase ErfK/SrfK